MRVARFEAWGAGSRVAAKSSSEPLRVRHGRVEVVCRLVAFERTRACRAGRLGQEGPHRLGRQRPEGPRGMERLLEALHRVAARDHDARRQVHRVMQALDRADGLAGRDLAIPEGLHPEDSDPLLHEDRQDLLLEALEVRVHHVQRHLDRVEPEPVLRGRLEHPEVNRGVLVSRETDIADPPRIPRLEGGLDRPALSEDPVRILPPNDLVELQEIDDVYLESLERLLDLPGGCGPCLAVDLGHQESSLAVAVPKGFPHADLAPPIVVVPGVVEEIDACVNRRPDDAKALRLREVRRAEVEPAEADRGHPLARAAERPHGNADADSVLWHGGCHLPRWRKSCTPHALVPLSATLLWMFPQFAGFGSFRMGTLKPINP